MTVSRPRRVHHVLLAAAALALSACGHGKGRVIDDASTVTIPAGPFVMGSDPLARAYATELSVKADTFHADTAVRLMEELPAATKSLETFAIMIRPVTQAEYHAYVLYTGTPEPYVDPRTWRYMDTGYGYDTVKRVLWADGKPAEERRDHPVVLVDHDDAQAYCRWWGELRGGKGSLPTEAQWEKAARGPDGRAFPWGDRFEPALVNSAEAQRGTTTAAGFNAATASPYGVLDMAGNVFEWTQTRADGGWIVKGGAYNTGAAAARAAARHARPAAQQHPAIGFRCALAARSKPKSKTKD